jgi:hypothetical protein
MLALISLSFIVLPPELSIVLAAFASWLSNYLRSDDLPRQWNILLAFGAFLVCIAATAWLTTGFSNDIRADVLLLIGIAVQLTLGGKELVDLLNYIKSVPSPLVEPQPQQKQASL